MTTVASSPEQAHGVPSIQTSRATSTRKVSATFSCLKRYNVPNAPANTQNQAYILDMIVQNPPSLRGRSNPAGFLPAGCRVCVQIPAVLSPVSLPADTTGQKNPYCLPLQEKGAISAPFSVFCVFRVLYWIEAGDQNR